MAFGSPSCKGTIELILPSFRASDAHVNGGRIFVLHAAITYNQRVDVVNAIASSFPAEIDSQDCHGNTALILAVAKGAYDTVTLLLRNGADISLHNAEGHSALHSAIVNAGRYKVSSQDYPSTLNLKDLPTSLKDEYPDGIIEGLLGNGADVNDWSSKGHTVLHLVVEYGLPPHHVKTILDRTRDVNLLDIYHNSILHIAVSGALEKSWQLGFMEDARRIVQQLLEAGADVNIQNGRGKTPLHLVLRHLLTQKGMVFPTTSIFTVLFDALCRYNVSDRIPDKDGQTVLQMLQLVHLDVMFMVPPSAKKILEQSLQCIACMGLASS